MEAKVYARPAKGGLLPAASAKAFLTAVRKAAPLKIRTILTDNVLNAIGLLPNGNSIVHRSGGADRETLKNGEQSRRRASAAQGCLG
jgi:hypothetical protein